MRAARVWVAALAAGLGLLLGGSATASADGFPDFEGSLGEGRFKRYVPPVANPLFHETPYITTEIRPIYLHNEVPDELLTDGGEIDVIACEVRIALTERLGFIASKDGYADVELDKVLTDDEDGFVNISFGLKYAVFSDPAREAIFTVGVEYEPPTGRLEVSGVRLQGKGSGLLDIFASGAIALGPVGLQAGGGVNVAMDTDFNSSMVHYSMQIDCEIGKGLYPLIAFNGFTIVDHGDRTNVNFEGIDLVNIGSTEGGTVITAAAGGRLRLWDNVILGGAFELPLTDRKDILEWRVYADVVIHL